MGRFMWFSLVLLVLLPTALAHSFHCSLLLFAGNLSFVLM